MLDFFRKRTKIIVWAVVIAFVAWGGYAVSLQFEESSRSPGRLFGKEVSYREFFQAQRAVEIFAPADSEKEEPPTPEEMEVRTWEFLMLSREAKRQKIKVSDDEIRSQITNLLGEKGTVGITGEQYQAWVRTALREEPRDFENQIREHLRIQKLLDQVKKESFGSPEEGVKNWLAELQIRAKLEVYKER